MFAFKANDTTHWEVCEQTAHRVCERDQKGPIWLLEKTNMKEDWKWTMIRVWKRALSKQR